jgi:hypothetical protein
MASTFTAPSIERKPDLICAGHVSEVGDARLGKSGNYYVVNIKLSGLDASKDQTVYWLFRPEFIRNMSHVELQRFQEENPGAYRMYRQHVCSNKSDGKVSHLQGLTVTDEKFNELAGRLLELTPEAIDADPTVVSNVLRQFLVEENGDTIIGYILSQQQEKTDEINPETGKPLYVPSKWLEVRDYWNANDDKVMKRQVAKAEKNPTRYRLAYTGVQF